MLEQRDEWTRKKQGLTSGATPKHVQSNSPHSQSQRSESEKEPDSDTEPQSTSTKDELTANRDLNILKGRSRFDFEVFARRWRHVVGRPPEGTKTNRNFYDEVCEEYGQESVLARIQPWADDQAEFFVKSKVGAWKFLSDGVHHYDEQSKRDDYPRL